MDLNFRNTLGKHFLLVRIMSKEGNSEKPETDYLGRLCFHFEKSLKVSYIMVLQDRVLVDHILGQRSLSR